LLFQKVAILSRRAFYKIIILKITVNLKSERTINILSTTSSGESGGVLDSDGSFLFSSWYP
jgi:hypothetical protein